MFDPKNPQNPILTALADLPGIELVVWIEVNRGIEEGELEGSLWSWYSEVGRLARAEQRARVSPKCPRPQDTNALWSITGNLDRDELVTIFVALAEVRTGASDTFRKLVDAFGLILSVQAQQSGIGQPERMN
jgi:hypothetical protein